MSITHSEKVALAVNDLVSRGGRPVTAAPPIIRQLWGHGGPKRPPHINRIGTQGQTAGVLGGAGLDVYIRGLILR